MTPFWILDPSVGLRTGFGFAIGRSKRKKIFCIALDAILFALCASAHAQQPEKIPRIGYLTNAPLSSDPAPPDAVRRGLRDLGYIEGKHFVIEFRSGERNRDRQRVLAAELARLKVAVIVAGGSGDIRAAKDATTTIPIVMVNGGDAVGSGFVASLARPAVTSPDSQRFARN